MAETERPLENLDQGELFRQALAPEPAPAPEVPQETTSPPPSEPTPTPEAVPPTEHIPAWRLREEAEARRTAEDRARQFEERLNQIQAHLQQQHAQAEKPDFFKDPDAVVQQQIMRVLAPYAEENRRTMMAMGKMIAESKHGADKVDAAEEAFLKARDQGVLDTMDYERVVQAHNRYDAVVQWHRQQNIRSTVGDDPKAWFEKELDTQLADPKFQSAMLERIQRGAAARPASVQIPPSLSRIPAAAGNASENLDGSDKGLWAFATKK